MLNYEGIFDGETLNRTRTTLVDKTDSVVAKYRKDLELASTADRKRELYTDILLDENVEELILKLSSEQCFLEDFPEFYVKNRHGEDVINCTQNNSYHRYGVFKHILSTIASVGTKTKMIAKRKLELLKWTMLLHDIGKPYVKLVTTEGNESFSGHDEMSVELAKVILERFNFCDEDIVLVTTLIKYHDKFLNEGEIIYDNLRVLAEELHNDKDAFYMLVEVKDADAEAKSIEVYNKYQLTRAKYLEFAELYFQKIVLEQEKNEDLITTEEDHTEISEIEYASIIEDIVSRNNITNVYEPIINVEKMLVMGYEVFSKINYKKHVEIKELLRYAEEKGKKEMIEQALLLNAIESFEEIEDKESQKAFFNISIKSFESYVNKPRIYDAMNRFEAVLEFSHYDMFDPTTLQTKVLAVQNVNGFVCLENFGKSIIEIDDLKALRPNYIKIDRAMIKDIATDEKLKKFISDLVTICMTREVEVIAFGIETREEYDTLKHLGVKNMQGYYLAKPEEVIPMLNTTIKDILKDGANDSIM